MAEEKLLVKRNGDFHYPIYFEEDFSNLSQVLKDEQMEGRRICVVADSNTAALYGEAVQKGTVHGSWRSFNVCIFSRGTQ